MSMCVCAGAVLQCPFGAAPSTLNVLPKAGVVTGAPIANIMDHIPLVNVMPFGVCSTPSNPVVAAATVAAAGVLTPMPCIPVTAAPWATGSPTVLVGGQPALNNSSKLMCAWGGAISVNVPGQFTIQVP